MGVKEKRSHKDHPPSIHSISSSEISASDVSSDNGSSVHERSTPKIAAIIIVGVLVIAILVGVTVYLTDTTRFVIQEIDLVRQVGEDFDALRNGTLEQSQDFLSGSDSDFEFQDEQLDTTTSKSNNAPLGDNPANGDYGDEDINVGEDDYDKAINDDEMIESDASNKKKQPRQRSKSYLDSLDPIKNFRSYPGRPGYSGPGTYYDDQEDQDHPARLFFFQDTEKLPRSSATEKSELNPKKQLEKKHLEIQTESILRDSINPGSNRRIGSSEDYGDYRDLNFGARQPGFSRKIDITPTTEQQLKDKGDSQSFTFRKERPGQNRPKTTKMTTTSTTPKSIGEDSIEINFGVDLDESEEETDVAGKNSFSEGTRLIPNYIFKSPSLPIREKMGSFETHLQGGPFGRTAARPMADDHPPSRPKRPMADSQPFPRPVQDFPRPPIQSIIRKSDGLPLPPTTTESKLSERPSLSNPSLPFNKPNPSKPINLSGMPTLDRRPGRPAFHHAGPLPRIDADGMERRGGPNRNTFGLNQPLFALPQQQRPEIPNPTIGIQSDDISETPFNDLRHLVSLAKEEVAVLREIARNITASGKELNLWEVMNAVNVTIRENPESPVAGLMRRFYQTYMDHVEESTPAPAPDRGVYEKSLSSLIFLSFGIFLLNSVNDLKAKREGKNFGESPVGRSLKALMSDRPEILELFSGGDGRKLGDPAGQSTRVNNYLRLLMNLMRVYSRSDSEEVDCVWTAYCHQLNMQAAPGGISSTIARINSVGLKLALRQLPSSDAFISVIRSLLSWEDLPCNSMFPECKTSLDEMQNKNISEESD